MKKTVYHDPLFSDLSESNTLIIALIVQVSCALSIAQPLKFKVEIDRFSCDTNDTAPCV